MWKACLHRASKPPQQSRKHLEATQQQRGSPALSESSGRSPDDSRQPALLSGRVTAAQESRSRGCLPPSPMASHSGLASVAKLIAASQSAEPGREPQFLWDYTRRGNISDQVLGGTPAKGSGRERAGTTSHVCCECRSGAAHSPGTHLPPLTLRPSVLLSSDLLVFCDFVTTEVSAFSKDLCRGLFPPTRN